MTKYAQTAQGCDVGIARQPMSMPDAAHQARIDAALAGLGAV